MNGTPDGDLVLVTGATGFIAKHVIKEALARGYRVRATVRRPAAEADVRTAVGERSGRLSFVQADLLSDAGWREAVAGCRYVLHVASAFPLVAPKDRDALLPVAREGTLRVLEAAAAAGVERTVVTSSCAAIWAGHPPEPARVFTEADWSLVDAPTIDSYSRSKTIAEREAWAFVERRGSGMALTAINPSFVMGPPLDRHVQSSADMPLMLLRGKYPLVPDWGIEIVDVRDVAAAHLAALEKPEAGGRRFIVSDGPLTMRQMGEILGRELPAFKGKMPKGTLPRWATRLLALVNPGVRQILPDLGPPKRTSSAAAREVLGIHCRPAEDALLAMARSLIGLGLV